MGKRVAIVGAGPVGLAAGCHAREQGLTPIIFEQGPEAGHAVRQWSHVRMFSPWAFNIDRAAARLLDNTIWTKPEPDAYPTGAEFIERYLAPLAARTDLASAIRTEARVTSITRKCFDKVKTAGREHAPFEIAFESRGVRATVEADTVIDASGTWFSPNPAGANGVLAPGEPGTSGQIAYSMPDVLGREREKYAGRTVAVLGSGHSAFGTLLDLWKLAVEAPGTVIIWLTRKTDIKNAFGGGDKDQLEERGALGLAFKNLVRSGRILVEQGFYLSSIKRSHGRLELRSEPGSSSRTIIVDRFVVATGFRPDLTFLRELRIGLDPALECPPALGPLIDPNVHSCGSVRPHGARELLQPEPGFYIAGMKSYGRAPTFLAVTGYEQVRSIVAEIAGDYSAAARVELALPETGVCSFSPVETQSGCCGGSAKVDVKACCIADEIAKAEGASGCGCSAREAGGHNEAAGCCG